MKLPYSYNVGQDKEVKYLCYKQWKQPLHGHRRLDSSDDVWIAFQASFVQMFPKFCKFQALIIAQEKESRKPHVSSNQKLVLGMFFVQSSSVCT